MSLVSPTTFKVAPRSLEDHKLINNHAKFEAKRTRHIENHGERGSTNPPPFPINHTCLAKTLDRLRVNRTSISSGGRGFESRSEIFSLSPCGPISLLGLMLRRYYLRYLLEHFKLPHLNHYMNFDITNSVSLYRELR